MSLAGFRRRSISQLLWDICAALTNHLHYCQINIITACPCAIRYLFITSAGADSHRPTTAIRLHKSQEKLYAYRFCIFKQQASTKTNILQLTNSAGAHITTTNLKAALAREYLTEVLCGCLPQTPKQYPSGYREFVRCASLH